MLSTKWFSMEGRFPEAICYTARALRNGPGVVTKGMSLGLQEVTVEHPFESIDAVQWMGVAAGLSTVS